ncbi:MAG: type II toxin-antitoxin system RelE/ParE family toxin [Desulfuromonadales bacterium]|nr:type II toxin-antitoxin system RelE/ParE family toxin [Desulfuromonadales bacterium]
MNKVFSVSLADSAVRDLEEIREYYEAQLVPEVGRSLIAEIIAAIKELSRFPDRGRVVPEFNQPLLRELIHPPFRIVYRRDAARVRIVRVWRSERLLQLP